MDSDGMEALLDFPEFIDVPSASASEEPVIEREPESVAPSENTTSSAIESASTEAAVNVAAEVPQSDESNKSIPAIEHPNEAPIGQPPRKKRKHHPAASSEAGPSTSKPSTSGHPLGEPADIHNDDSGPGSPSEQDFESDFLDLMPFKEEDPEDVAERQKLQLLISHLSEEQLNRYEVYRRASFPKASVRRIMQTVSGCTVSQNAVIAMAGIAKMQVGEIVEHALDVKEQWADVGPVQPKHIREALRQLRNRPATTSSKFRKKQSNSNL
ncbi:transcription initiation factor TFIID subunit 11-like [Paramacrobiotus metropolitanus]|uniref:transcription initiation factor TFIID subunit 11-like n=1 Tax=Paramacrobiotus metropolitanus TaxID=2943436 RepID=UPI002445EC41|nr:transcription initiation factor TFIID subunit 11-like [Paramacrobiotus metropolitanus]